MKPICKLTLCCLLFVPRAFAQKLPEVQKGGMRAPATVKIDGKLDEWGSLSAYNKRIVVYYSIANDDENLYLIIRSDNWLITSKILQGGLTFTVSTSGKKDKDVVAVTFPVVGDKELQAIIRELPKPSNSDKPMSGAQQKEAEVRFETAMAASNRKLITQYKFIALKGIKGIAEKEISIYNDLGIKTGAFIETGGAYTSELALPLKYLNLTANNSTLINYNIKLLAKHVLTGMTIPFIISQDGSLPPGPGGVDRRSMTEDTDFWGEYLLKK